MNTKVKNWTEVTREIAFQKYGRQIEKVIYKLPDDKETDFYIKKEGLVACVLAVTKDNKVILVKQFRPGPNKILSELPGGFVDHNEDPEEAARRELMEETGYKGNLKFVTTSFHDAYSTMKKYCFVATDCEKVGKPQTDIHELVELDLLTIEEFRQLLRSGNMTDIEVGFLGLDFLNLLH